MWSLIALFGVGQTASYVAFVRRRAASVATRAAWARRSSAWSRAIDGTFWRSPCDIARGLV